MYELREAFKRQLRPAIQAGLGPLVEKMIMDAFDAAVYETEQNHLAELRRAGMIKKAA